MRIELKNRPTEVYADPYVAPVDLQSNVEGTVSFSESEDYAIILQTPGTNARAVAIVELPWKEALLRELLVAIERELEPNSAAKVYDGPIRAGMKFTWEPRKAYAYERVEVVEVVNNGEKVMVKSRNKRGEEHWNDESRFREACEPCD